MANEVATLVFKAKTESLKKAEVRLKKLKQEANEAGEAAGKSGGKFAAMAAAMAKAVTPARAAGAALVVLTGAIVAMIPRFKEAEQGQIKLNNLFKATGGTAGLTASHINSLSEEIGRNTLQSASGMRDAAGALMTFKTISGKTFEDTIRLTADLAAVTGGDARQAALQFGKALEDPATGLSALKRSGVSFTQAQKDSIIAMQKGGDIAKAQTTIIAALQGQFGGAGDQDGLAGAVDLVGENFDLLSDRFIKASGIGSALTSIMSGLGNAIGGIADVFAEKNPQEKLDELIARRENLANKKFVIGREGFLEDFDSQIAEQQQIVDDAAAKEKAAEEAAQAERDKINAENVKKTQFKNAQLKATHDAELLDIKKAQQERADNDEAASATQLEAELIRMQAASDKKLEKLAETDTEERERINQLLAARKEEAKAQHQQRLADIAQEKQDEADAKAEEKIEAQADTQEESNRVELLRKENEIALAVKQENLVREAELQKEFDELELQQARDMAVLKGELTQAQADALFEQQMELLTTQHETRMELIKEQQDEEDVLKQEKRDKELEDELKFHADHGSIIAKAKLAQAKLDKLTGKKRLAAQKKEGMDMLAFLGGNSRKAFELHKALSLGSAIVQTAKGVAEAASEQNYGMAARIAATGAMEIATIKSTQFGGGGSGSSSVSGGGGGAEAAESTPVQSAQIEEVQEVAQVVNVSVDGSIDPEGARRIIEAINDATMDGLEINALVGS